MIKRWLIGSGILLYLLVCGLILRVMLRPEPSSSTLTVGNLTVDVDPHWAAHDSGSIFNLSRKGFSLNPLANGLTLIPGQACVEEAEVQQRISNLQQILETSQKLIPGSRVKRDELMAKGGPVTCVETYSALNADSPTSITCILHKDASTFQGTVEGSHLNEALSMIRSTRDSTSCDAPSDDSAGATRTK